MTNFEALIQMPLGSFANMAFHTVKYDCATLQEFEEFLKKTIDPELEDIAKEALQKMQCSNQN